MPTQQGFKTTAGFPYIYQELAGVASTAIGMDPADAGKFNITIAATPDVVPEGGVDLLSSTPAGAVTLGDAVDGTTVTLSPGPASNLVVSTFGNGVVLSSSTGVITSLNTAAANTVLVSNGAGVAPSWQAVPATAGVTSLAGTANEITVSAATGNVTLSVPATFIAPGSAASTTLLTAGNGFTVTTGTITLSPLTTAGIVTTTNTGVISSEAVLPIANGGTNTNTTPGNFAVMYFDGTKYVGLANSTTGNILGANTGAAPSWIAAPSGGVPSIAGTANQITETGSPGATTLSIPNVFIAPGSIEATSTVQADTNFLLPTTSSTAGQIKWNNVTYLHTMGSHQVFLGDSAGNFTTGALGNVGVGFRAGLGLTSGGTNVLIGYEAGDAIADGQNNVIIGALSTRAITSGINNVMIGYQNATLLGTGNESYNIFIGNNVTGINGESNVLRIGQATGSSAGQLNKAFISGIYNTAVGATAGVALVDSSNQVGGLAGAAGTVLVGGTKPAFSALTGLAVTAIAGTANQITASASTGSVTLSIPNTFIAPGSIEATSTVKADTNFLLPTTSSTAGQLQINSVRFAHSFGTRNTFLGATAGNFTLTTGSALANTAVGAGGALSALTTGQANVAVGDTTFLRLSSGSFNTGVGQDVAENITTGSRNTFIGNGAGAAYTGAESSNILIGMNTAGTLGESNKMRLGKSTGSSTDQINATFIAGVYNTAVGATAGVALVDSTDQVGGLNGAAGTVLVGGTKPAFSALTGLAVTAIAGTANQITASASTGSVTLSTPATFIAPGSAASTTTLAAGTNLLMPSTSSTAGQIEWNNVTYIHTFGTSNLWLGNGSGNFTYSGNGGNVCIGTNTGTALTTGEHNVFIGHLAGVSQTTGGTDVGIGQNALNALTATVGSRNVAIGGSALDTATACIQNVCIGHSAGHAYTTNEHDNIQIGYNVTGTLGESNVLRVGTATGTGAGNLDKAVICGINGKTSTSGTAVFVNASDVLGTSTSSIRYKDRVQDMGDDSKVLYHLRPVSFHYNQAVLDERKDEDLKQYGLIAEEVAVLDEGLVMYKDGVPETVRYHFFVPMLIAELQNLRTEITKLQKKVRNLGGDDV